LSLSIRDFPEKMGPPAENRLLLEANAKAAEPYVLSASI
jgi:hypothetical protein